MRIAALAILLAVGALTGCKKVTPPQTEANKYIGDVFDAVSGRRYTPTEMHLEPNACHESDKACARYPSNQVQP